MKKFGSGNSVEVEIQALQLRYKKLSSRRLKIFEGGDARSQELQKELTAVEKTLLMEAKKVSEARTEAAKKLSALVTQEIQQLSTPPLAPLSQRCRYS